MAGGIGFVRLQFPAESAPGDAQEFRRALLMAVGLRQYLHNHPAFDSVQIRSVDRLNRDWLRPRHRLTNQIRSEIRSADFVVRGHNS